MSSGECVASPDGYHYITIMDLDAGTTDVWITSACTWCYGKTEKRKVSLEKIWEWLQDDN
jgi:hypothetical protein